MRWTHTIGTLGLCAGTVLTNGCMRYYAGDTYAASWSGPTAPPPVTGFANGSATATLATENATPPIVVLGSVTNVTADGTLIVAGATSGASTSGGLATGATSGGAVPAAATMSNAHGGLSLDVSGRLASNGTLHIGLFGLASGGVEVNGGLARLGDLRPITVPWSTPALYADAHLSVHASLAHDALPLAGGETQVVVEVAGLAPPAVRPPLRVHLVLDASQSMRGGWGDVLDAANAVVARLRPQDELQIVVYGTDATEALPPTAVGDGSRARAVISHLHFGGRTNIEAGLRLAYGRVQTGGRSLVILVSDGVPQGGLSTPDELGSLAAEANARAGAITLSVGLGTEFHTGVLSTLAQQGGGDFRIAPRSSELRLLLETELRARGGIVATDLVTNVQAAQGVTLNGDANFRLGALAAGETRTFVVPATVSHTGNIAHVSLRFNDVNGRPIVVEGALDVASAPRALAQGAMTATLDAGLADALVVCGRAIENGDGALASAALELYVSEVQAVIASRPDMAATAALRVRNEAALRIASALPGLVTGASWGERRRTGAAFVEWSFSLR